MSDIIHLLPDSIANQIAAGEVIQRPASVVKELVENAIDAGATQIQIQIKEAGKTLVQVIDNGKGMSEADARMAFERHATSKISKPEDLFALHTMGFRGEALASIAAVAQVELRTRQQGAELGTKLEIDGSELQYIEADACAEGSMFSERIALVNPSVALSLYHNDTEILNLPESGLRQRIINIYGKNQNQKLLSLEAASSLASITGFVGRPDAAKKRGALQYFFVNGRFMKHPYFHKAVMQAYEQLIPAGEMPSYFIYFQVDPATIDVNIHPTKTEIKFENEQPIRQILLAAIRETLAKSSAIPTIDFNLEDVIDIPVYNPERQMGSSEAPKVQVHAEYNPFRSESTERTSRPAFDWTELYQSFESERAAAMPDEKVFEKPIAVPEEKALFQQTAPATMPCFQYKNHYLLTTLKSGLAVIDQHRAHLRVLFDQYQKSIRQQKTASQQMLFPARVELTPAEEAALPALLDDLGASGFDISNLGGGSYSINGVPVGMEGIDCVDLLKDIIHKAIETDGKAQDEIIDLIAFSLASAQAIPVGKTLSAEEMDHLLASLFLCPDIHLTPDGKTIYTLLTDDELAKRFG